jgi:hypothetical protein
LGGIFPGANEEFENGIDGRAGVGLRVHPPAPKVSLEKKLDPQMREEPAPIQPGVPCEKRFGQGLNSSEGFFQELDVSRADLRGVFAE